MSLICKDHPKYKALRPPRCKCAGCLLVYALKKDGNVAFCIKMKVNELDYVRLEMAHA